jgi:hypothetical protein
LKATELQADEIRTILHGKQQPTWIFAAIEVWSRVWSSTVVGRRSYENTMALFRDVAERVGPEDIPLITTDGFEFYERVVWQVFGPACVYGQVLKKRRNNRIVKVERRTVIGTEGRLAPTRWDAPRQNVPHRADTPRFRHESERDTNRTTHLAASDPERESRDNLLKD